MDLEEQQNNDSFIKPSFDGRQHFYKLLNKYQETLGFARHYDDFVTMEQSLRNFLIMVSPYIKHSKEIKAELDNIKKFLLPKFINKFRNHISNKLDDITMNLFKESKYMMLPFKEEETGEFDWDEFERESDL